MYADFIHVSVHGDIERVGGAGNWVDILNEYTDLIKTPKSESIFKLWQKINTTEKIIDLTDTLLNILSDNYSLAAAESLVLLGYGFVEDLDDHDAYLKQLEMIDREAKTLFVLLNQYKSEYEKMVPVGTNLQRSEIDFEKDLAVLARYGYKIDKRTQMVIEYCGAVNAFIEEQSLLNKKNGRPII